MPILSPPGTRSWALELALPSPDGTGSGSRLRVGACNLSARRFRAVKMAPRAVQYATCLVALGLQELKISLVELRHTRKLSARLS